MELGEVGEYYTYVAIPTRRRPRERIRWVGERDTRRAYYRNLPVQPLDKALRVSMPMLDPRKQASALDAVERQHPQYASLVATLAKEYGLDRKDE